MRVGWFERTALKHVYYHMWNRWPVQVQCMKKKKKKMRANKETFNVMMGTIKDRLLDSLRESKGGMIWENIIETCILPYVK